MAYAGKDSGRVRREELTAWTMAPSLSGTVFEMREVPHVGCSLTVWLVDLVEDQTKQAESTLLLTVLIYEATSGLSEVGRWFWTVCR